MPPPPAGPSEARVAPLTDEFVLAVASFGRGRSVIVNGVRVRWVEGCGVGPLRRLAGSLSEADIKSALRRANAGILDVFLRSRGADFWPSTDVWIRAERRARAPPASVYAVPPRAGAELPPAAFVCRGACWIFSAAERVRVENFTGMRAQLAPPMKKRARVAWCAREFLGTETLDAQRMFHDHMMSLRRELTAACAAEEPADSVVATDSVVNTPKPGALPAIERISLKPASESAAVVAIDGQRALAGFLVGADTLVVLGEAPAGKATTAVQRRALFQSIALSRVAESWVPLALRLPLVRVSSAADGSKRPAAFSVGLEGSSLSQRLGKLREDMVRSGGECTPHRLRAALDFLALRGEDLRVACACLGLELKNNVVGGSVLVARGTDGLWRTTSAGCVTDGTAFEDDGPPKPTAWESVAAHFLPRFAHTPTRSLWKHALDNARSAEEAHVTGALVSPPNHPAFVNDNALQVAGPLTALRIEWTIHGTMSFSWCGKVHAKEACAADAWACAIRIGGTPVWESDAADSVHSAEGLATAAKGTKRGARVDVAWGARGATSDVCVALRSNAHGMVVVRLAVR